MPRTLTPRTLTRCTALAAVAVLWVALVACSGGSGQGGPPGETAQSLAEKTQYNPQPYENLKDGGALTTSLPEISPQFNTFETDGTGYTLTGRRAKSFPLVMSGFRGVVAGRGW
jgi:peptide/nickel transport system substrate-binding protein